MNNRAIDHIGGRYPPRRVYPACIYDFSCSTREGTPPVPAPEHISDAVANFIDALWTCDLNELMRMGRRVEYRGQTLWQFSGFDPRIFVIFDNDSISRILFNDENVIHFVFMDLPQLFACDEFEEVKKYHNELFVNHRGERSISFS